MALGIRVLIVVAWDSYEPFTDARDYDRIATNMANLDGYGEARIPGASGPSAFRAPLYPASLAVVYAVAGDGNWTAGRLANSVLGTVAVGLIGLIAGQLWSRREALVAMAIGALDPMMLLFGSPLALEPLLIVLSLSAVAAVLAFREHPVGLRWPMLAGALLGLAALAREQGLLLVPPLAWLLLNARKGTTTGATRWRPLLAPAVMVVACLVVVAPWTIRNYEAFDEFVPVSTSSGMALAGVYNATAQVNPAGPAQWVVPWRDSTLLAIITDDPDRLETELDDLMLDAAFTYVRENPESVLRTLVWGTLRTFDLEGGRFSRFISQFVPYPPRLVDAAVIGGWLTLAGGLAAVLSRRVRAVPWQLWSIPAGLSLVIAVGLSGGIRYRAAIEPWLILMLAAGSVALFDWWRTRTAAGQAEGPRLMRVE